MNTIFKVISILSLLLSGGINQGFGASGHDTTDACGVKVSFPPSDQVGGRFIPSVTPNSYFRIMVVFAQFKDDTTYAVGDWPSCQGPTYMSTFIDSTTTEMSNFGDMTQYFWEMSQNTFKVIGNCYSVITDSTRQWYNDHYKGRGYINQDVIQKLNRTINFAAFDNWHRNAKYSHTNNPDGFVDMICVIWRNINQDASFPYLASQFAFNGEASLGGGSTLPVDGGARYVVMQSYDTSSGSGGLTIAKGYNGRDLVQKYTIHELGHHLLGGGEYHMCGGTWGMMWNWTCRSSMANSFERMKLGWITIMQYNSNPPSPVSLTDYLTTGQALRIALPNSYPQEYFYLENHQRISMFDKPDANYPEKGLYVLHMQSTVPNTNYDNNLGQSPRFISADGKWTWVVDHYIQNPWGSGTLPVFRRISEDPINGYFESDSITYTDPQTGLRKSDFIYFMVDPVTGQNDTSAVTGDGRDAFTLSHHLFSGSTNPPTLTSSRVVSPVAIDETYDAGGIVKVQLYINCWSGTLTQNTTISGDATVMGNLVVNPGVTLTIAPGTNLTFLSGASLTVNGTLVADTTFTIPIGSTMTLNPGSAVVFGLFTELIIRGMINANGATFTSNVQPRYSYGFVLVNATGSSFSNCTFSGVTAPIDDNASNPTLDHCTFNNWSGEDALGFYGSSPTITNCKFEGSSQTNNSIRFTANSNGTPSGGTVSNCVIENSGAGNGIVVMGGSSPVIVSDTIRNNHYHGIVVVENGSGRPNINSNILACNGVANGAPTYNGTDFYMSGGLLRLNAITGSNFGIYCDSYSSPSSSSNPPFGERGSNIVTNNRIGMNVYNHSYPVFGTTGPWGPDDGCNLIYSSTDYDIAATVSSIVTAEWNWWGQSPPNPNKFFTATNSTIDYSNWLPNSNCPFGGANIVKAPDRKTITSDPSSESTSILFQQAMIARSSGLYDTAKTLYRRILQITTTDVDRQHALVGLFNVFQESSDTSIVADFQSYSPRGTSSLKSSVELGQIAEELLGQSYMATKQIPKAHAVANDLIAKYPGTDLEKRALILIASLRAYDPSTDKISAEAVNELKKRFGSSIDQGLIAALDVWDNVPQIEIASPSASLGQSMKSIGPDTVSVGQVEFQMENYPNPFNPSTMIRYQIPKAGKVVLKVYDILGREVRTLVDAYQEVGEHSVQFNADNLASGIYFYRFSAPGINLVKKMLLVK